MEEPSQPKDEEPISLVEMFRKLCPSYMVMGMTYDEFWHSNTVVHKAFREAFEIRKHNDEWNRWRHGSYVYEALLCAAPVMRAFGKGKVEPGKFPDEPWPLTNKEAHERQERDRRNAYNRMKAKLFAEAKRDMERLAKAAEAKDVSEDA